MLNSIPSISDSFNAKTTTTEELCATFIPNDFFEELAGPNSCIVIGPRGSGKTTLMRMLDVESLELWDGATAQIYREKINFSGVFIPTDRYWKTQYEKIEDRIIDESSCIAERNRCQRALHLLNEVFVYHVVDNFLSILRFRCSRTIDRKNNFRQSVISKETELELVSELSLLWKVKPAINTLRSLCSAVLLKKQMITEKVNKLLKGDDIEDDCYYELNIVDIIKTSVSVANVYLDEKSGKWSFLFDELELAPSSILQPLVDETRGGHKDIIFKLALSPYHNDFSITYNSDSAMKGQDLSTINLTGLNNEDGLEFSKQLCTSLFQRKGLFNNVDTYFEQPEAIDIDSDFKELIDKDPNFYKYLIDRNLISSDYSNSNSLLRKIKFITHIRNYKRDNNNNIKARRRPADFYAGFNNICKSVEYNPRMIIGLMNNFILIVKKSGKVTIHQQLLGLSEYFDSFKALLSTIAVESNNDDFNNIYDFTNEIANVFKMEIHGDEFKSEPKGCFSIDNSVSKELLEVVGCALNSGAIVEIYIDPAKAKKKNIIKLCRLSYMFSPHFDLLLTKQKTIDIHDLIKMTKLNSNKINMVNALRKSNVAQYNLELK